MIADVHNPRAKLVRERVQRAQMLVALAQRLARRERPLSVGTDTFPGWRLRAGGLFKVACEGHLALELRLFGVCAVRSARLVRRPA